MSQRHYGEVELGDELGPLLKEPTREQIRDYVGLSEVRMGRFTSEEAAQSEGLRGIIVPGQHEHVLPVATPHGLGRSRRDSWRSWRSTSAGWLSRATGWSARPWSRTCRRLRGKNVVTLDAFIENQKGERPIQGIAEVVLPS